MAKARAAGVNVGGIVELAAGLGQGWLKVEGRVVGIPPESSRTSSTGMSPKYSLRWLKEHDIARIV